MASRFKDKLGMEDGVEDGVESSPEHNSCCWFGVVFKALWTENWIMIWCVSSVSIFQVNWSSTLSEKPTN